MLTSQSEFHKILAKPGQRALASIGIENLEQLSNFMEEEIIGLHGIGKNGMDRLRIALSEKGLSFTQKK